MVIVPPKQKAEQTKVYLEKINYFYYLKTGYDFI